VADWFKFYNDGLDAGGLQYCIAEQPLVTSVWLVILSEASKSRCCKFPWDDKDFRLLGFARKVNVSPGVFNQCVNLLEHAGYIKKREGYIEIPGWDKLQSDYAKGLDKGYYKKTSKTLASNSEHSTARREEKRVEENIKTSRFSPPSLDEVKVAGLKAGLPDNESEAFFNYYESNGWKVGKNPMKKWLSALANWRNKYQTNHAINKGNGEKRIDRSIGTANEGIASQYKGLGRVA